MTRENMIKELEATVEVMEQAKQDVYAFVDSIDEAKEEGAEVVKQLESVIESKKEALYTVADLGEAKLSKGEIDKLAEELELQKMVNEAKVKGMKIEIEDVAEAFLQAHTAVKTKYKEVDKYLLPNTTLGELEATVNTMQSLANKADSSLSRVRECLLDTGVIDFSIKVYKGVHLNQSALSSEIGMYHRAVKDYLFQVRRAGYTI